MSDAQDPRRLGILHVRFAYLVQALQLPADTKIDEVCVALDQPGVIRLRIESPGLAAVAPGSFVPRVDAEFKAEMVEGPVRNVNFVRWRL